MWLHSHFYTIFPSSAPNRHQFTPLFPNTPPVTSFGGKFNYEDEQLKEKKLKARWENLSRNSIIVLASWSVSGFDGGVGFIYNFVTLPMCFPSKYFARKRVGERGQRKEVKRFNHGIQIFQIDDQKKVPSAFLPTILDSWLHRGFIVSFIRHFLMLNKCLGKILMFKRFFELQKKLENNRVENCQKFCQKMWRFDSQVPQIRTP